MGGVAMSVIKTPATTIDQLISCQAAILAIESGEQSYSIDGQAFTKANLQSLYDREDRLLTRYNRESVVNPRVSYARMVPSAYRDSQ